MINLNITDSGMSWPISFICLGQWHKCGPDAYNIQAEALKVIIKVSQLLQFFLHYSTMRTYPRWGLLLQPGSQDEKTHEQTHSWPWAWSRAAAHLQPSYVVSEQEMLYIGDHWWAQKYDHSTYLPCKAVMQIKWYNTWKADSIASDI